MILQPMSDLELPGKPPPSARKVAFLDFETTGFQASKCDVIEVAVIRDGMPWDAKVKITEWDEKRGDIAGGSAWRKVTGYTRERWADAGDPSVVAHEFARQMHGCVMVAFNAAFDCEVAQRFVERYGIPWAMVYTGAMIDLHPLCRDMLGPIGLKKCDLSSVCEFLGFEPETEHRALGGATRCRMVYEELCKRVHRP